MLTQGRRRKFEALVVSTLSFALFFTLISCESLRSSQESSDSAIDAFRGPVHEFTAETDFTSDGPTGCVRLFDTYCSALYSPRAGGNLRVPQSSAPAMILQGETRNNFTSVYMAYAQAKLKRANRLPGDLRTALDKRSYFSRLRQLLTRKPRGMMSVQDRIDADQLEHSLKADWDSSQEEVILRRMRKHFPSFHSLSEREIPIEWQIEHKRVRRILLSDISKSIWTGDRNWKKVEKGFQELRNSYLDVIADMEAPESLRQAWAERINSIELVLPGSLPAIADEECASTRSNAYYYSYLNLITVCAGDFNSEDIMQTLAHEMGHALDIDRSRYLYQRASPAGQALTELRNQVCSQTNKEIEFSCSNWENFKKDYAEKLASLRNYVPEMPEFNRCLARRRSNNSVGQSVAQQVANREIRERFADLAGADYFLRIVKKEIPMTNGKMQKNPNFLNPCSYYMWSHGEEPLDDGLWTMIFFTAEFRCSQEKSDAEKLKASLAKAEEMSVALDKELVLEEGEFSNRKGLEVEGLSSSPVERFADVVGSHALSRTLNKFNLVWQRRNAFLASSSWQCEVPGLASSFPTESSIQREWELDAHSEGRSRVYESFSAPIRSTLSCSKDFEFKECELPLRQKHLTQSE